MPRKPTGNVYESRGRWYARVTVAKGQRATVPLLAATDEPAALDRLTVLVDLAVRMRSAGVAPDVATGLLERAGGAADAKTIAFARRAVDEACAGKLAAKPTGTAALSPQSTFQQVGEAWTNGHIHRAHPDRVPEKRSIRPLLSTLTKHVYPVVGHVEVSQFTLEDAEAVMARLPEDMEPRSRGFVAGAMLRVLSLAVYPLKFIKAHPVPRQFRAAKAPKKAKGWLYPDEDARLMACQAVPLCWRLYYGFLHREGPRSNEATRFEWTDLDLDRGGITLDENKTNDPRAWALSPGVANALRLYRDRFADTLTKRSGGLVFTDDAGRPLAEQTDHQAEVYRNHLRLAGIARPELFETSKSRRRIRLHDTRATFITIALANGKTETWVMDRTGHRSSAMINLYRRAARTAAELGLGDLEPLDQAIPELAALPNGGGNGGASGWRGVACGPSVGDDTGNSTGSQPAPVLLRAERNAAEPCRTAANHGASEASAATSQPLDRPAALSGATGALSGGARQAVLDQLSSTLRAALEAGDVTGARVLHKAIGDLLGA